MTKKSYNVIGHCLFINPYKGFYFIILLKLKYLISIRLRKSFLQLYSTQFSLTCLLQIMYFLDRRGFTI